MNREAARESISEIYDSLAQYKDPEDYYPPTTCDGYHFILRPSTVRQPKVAGLYNGLAVLYTSNNFATQNESLTPFFSNRFILPDSDASDIRFYRQPLFDPSESISLRGFDEIAADPGVVSELEFVNGALKRSLEDGGFDHVIPSKLFLSREQNA